MAVKAGWKPRHVIAIAAIGVAGFVFAPVAVSAATQLVSIADATDATKLAKVDSSGKLNVGDGSGGLTVDGTINKRDVAPTMPIQISAGINLNSSFIKIATPPAGKGLVVTSLNVNTFANPTPGQAQNIQFYIGPTSSGPLAPVVAQVNPPGLGLVSVDTGTGIVVPANNSLWADGNGSVQGNIFGFGYAQSSVAPMVIVTPAS